MSEGPRLFKQRQNVSDFELRPDLVDDRQDFFLVWILRGDG